METEIKYYHIEALRNMQNMIKTMEKLLSIMSNIQTTIVSN